MTRSVAVAGSIAAILATIVFSADLSSPNSLNRETEPAVEMSGLRFITPDTQQSIDRGLQWLAGQQQSNGAFGSGLMSTLAVMHALSSGESDAQTLSVKSGPPRLFAAMFAALM